MATASRAPRRSNRAANRRKARVTAIQTLYEVDGSDHPAAGALRARLRDAKLPEAEMVFTKKLVCGVLANKREIDTIVGRHAPDWPVAQMAMVDRNILRVAIYELLFGGETPPKVAINEAVELGRIFGADRSPMFVNGVLGGLMQQQEQCEQPKCASAD